jgi:hypothetical protein
VDALADGARWALMTLLVLAALEKLASLLRGTAAWHPVLLVSPTRRRWAGWLMGASLLADSTALFLLVASPRRGAALTLALIVVYTSAALPLHTHRSSDCRCFSNYFNSKTRSGLVARNAWIVLMTVLVLLTSPNASWIGLSLGGLLLATTLLLIRLVDRGTAAARWVVSGEEFNGAINDVW